MSTHLRRLRWLGFSLATAIGVNLTCVLYAVTQRVEGPASEADVATHTAREDDVEVLTLLTPEQSRAIQQRLVPDEPATSPSETGTVLPVFEIDPATDFGLLSEHAPNLGRIVALQRPGGIVRQSSHRLSRAIETLVAWNLKAEDLVSSDQPAHDMTDATEARGGDLTEDVTILNPPGNRGTVSFLANGEPKSLEPGQEQRFQVESLRLDFHRGGSFGTASHSVSTGKYRFVVGKKGWSLEKSSGSW